MVLAARSAASQEIAVPQRAYGIGLNTTAGLIGVEWVDRSFAQARRFGGAAGLGLFGGGLRLNGALRDPLAHTLVPYLASGFSVAVWSIYPYARSCTCLSIETGVQLWPKSPRRIYVDFGVGAAFEMGRSGDPLPALRILAGRTF